MAGKPPVEKRRGRGAGHDETPETFLIDAPEGDVDAVFRAVAALDEVGGIGDVATHVTEELLDGTLPAPHGRWELLIRLTGQRWLILTRSGTGVVPDGWHGEANALARQLGRPVIAAADDGPSGGGARFVWTDAAGRTLVEFVSHGEDYSLDDVEANHPLVGKTEPATARFRATRFTSDRHEPDWWRQRSPAKSLDQLLKAARAYLPSLSRGDDGTHATLDLPEGDDALREGIERIDLVAFGEPGKTRARPTEADLQLTRGIRAGDPAVVAAALAAGADPDRPAGVTDDGLTLALHALKSIDEALLTDRLAVVEWLLDAGAGGNGVPSDRARRDAWWRQRKRAALTDVFRAHWTVDGDDAPELDLPASAAGDPPRVTVAPRAFTRWWDVRRRDQQAAALEALGFDRLGEFAVFERPAIRTFVMHHYELRAFATLNEVRTIGWAEVVRWHGDGSSLAVSNAPLEPSMVNHDVPGHRKVVQPRWGVNKLVEFIRAEPPPPGVGIELVRAKDFKPRFEQYAADELVARRRSASEPATPGSSGPL